jgi:adenosylcobinamide-GDP ribazoletransferase
MRVIRGLKNAVAFLTILPLGMDRDALVQAAEFMPTFPIIGAIIGLVCGILVWALDPFLPSLIVGLLGLGFLLLLTGVHHTDGLLDFGDAMIFHGKRDEKLRIMRDSQTGAGGFSLGLVVLGATALSIAAIDRGIVIQGLIASEAAAKFAMVFQASTGESAHKGMSTPFVEAMHGKWRWTRLGAALGLQLTISATVLQTMGLALTASALIAGAAMLMISTRSLGGVTGDVMGATNDVTRLFSLLVITAGARWV